MKQTFSKEERSKRVLRGVKTLFFLISMFISLLWFSAPILLIIADTLLPSVLLSASLSPSPLSLQTISSHLSNYDFRYSLIDIPLISIIRSAFILCVYSLCDGPRLSRGPYLGTATICSISSLIFVSLKASYVFGESRMSADGEGLLYRQSMEVALFVSSIVMAIGHIVVAYRTSCRERRKLLVYKIDIEAWWEATIVTTQKFLLGKTCICVLVQKWVTKISKNSPLGKNRVKEIPFIYLGFSILLPIFPGAKLQGIRRRTVTWLPIQE